MQKNFHDLFKNIEEVPDANIVEINSDTEELEDLRFDIDLIEEDLESFFGKDDQECFVEFRRYYAFPCEFANAHTAGLADVTDEILDNAYEHYISGEGKPWTDKEVERVAVHEGGHTLVNVLLGNKPSYLTIVSRGDHGGYMQHGDVDDKHINTRQQLLDDVCCSLGGRAAELIYYGDELGITTGASGDLSQATKMLRNMICTYGMYEDVGMISDNKPTSVKNVPSGFSPETEAVIEKKINELLAEQLDRAKKLISDNDDKMKNLLAKLKDKQYLTEKEILFALEIK